MSEAKPTSPGRTSKSLSPQQLQLEVRQYIDVLTEGVLSLAPPSSSVAVRHGPCLLTEKRILDSKPKARGKFSAPPTWSTITTNNWVQSTTSFPVSQQEPLLPTVKRRKLAWLGHASRHDSLSKTILQGTLESGVAVVGRGNFS